MNCLQLFIFPFCRRGGCITVRWEPGGPNALSKLSAVGFARMEEGVVKDFRFALGAVAPRVVRLTEAENLITGKSSRSLDCESVLAAAAPRVRPIDDQAFYR